MGSVSAASKRRALSVLPAPRLRELVDRCGLEPSDRRSKDGLLSALADGRRVAFGFGAVLALLGHDELVRDARRARLETSGRGWTGRAVRRKPWVARLPAAARSWLGSSRSAEGAGVRATGASADADSPSSRATSTAAEARLLDLARDAGLPRSWAMRGAIRSGLNPAAIEEA